MAQTMVIGIARTLLAGTKNFISFIVLFSLSQSIGGLIGGALLGTFQVVREKYHSHELVQAIVMTDPLVAARIGAGSGVGRGVVGDPACAAPRVRCCSPSRSRARRTSSPITTSSC
jgi:hypothetical protein